MVSSYATLWTHVYFNIPQDTKAAKTAARRFIKKVRLMAGFQLVVSRGRGSCLMPVRYDRAVSELKAALPPDGELRLVPVTDKQVEKSSIFWGEMRKLPAAN